MEYLPLINKPIRISANLSSLIDNIWTDNVKFLTQIVILGEILSDRFRRFSFPKELNSHSRLWNQNTIKLFN